MKKKKSWEKFAYTALVPLIGGLILLAADKLLDEMISQYVLFGVLAGAVVLMGLVFFLLWKRETDSEEVRPVEDHIMETLPEKSDDPVVPDNGILKRADVHPEKRHQGEVFMAELLTSNIHLHEKDGWYVAEICRDGVDEVVVTTPGKQRLVGKYVNPQRDSLRELDKEIQRFLTGGSSNRSMVIPLGADYKMRWASGGVLSVITYRGRSWIPLFFRDIKPYGWNIALGATERYFHDDNKVANEIEYELNQPDRFIFREFLEETLILEQPAVPGVNYAYSISVPQSSIAENEQRRIQFLKEHRRLRLKEDRVRIERRDNEVHFGAINSKMQLKIKPPGESPHLLTQALVCFSLLDLGIEVVELLKCHLPDSAEILDGEIWERYVGDTVHCELIRQPVALISCEFLHRMFKGDITEYEYVGSNPPSVRIPEQIPEEEIHIFPFEVKKRLEVVSEGTEATVSEAMQERYIAWHDMFGNNFQMDGDKVITDNASSKFTPATAKILNLFFTHVDESEWKNLRKGK